MLAIAYLMSRNDKFYFFFLNIVILDIIWRLHNIYSIFQRSAVHLTMLSSNESITDPKEFKTRLKRLCRKMDSHIFTLEVRF